MRIFLVAAAVPILFRLKITSIQNRFAVPIMRRAASPESEAKLIGRIDRVLRFGYPLVRRGCLTRSFTRYYFLRHFGVPVELVFGVGPFNGSYEGHCWLEKDGEPYLESRDPRPLFTRMYSFPKGA